METCVNAVCQSNYLVGVSNTNIECPNAYSIQDEAACRAAATSLALTWGGVGSWGNNARGCIKANTNSAYLNNHPTGAAAASRITRTIRITRCTNVIFLVVLS